MKKRTRYLAIGMAALLVIVAAAVVIVVKVADRPTLPDYVSTPDESLQFEIGSWVGVPNYVVTLDSGKEVQSGSAREMTDEEFLAQYRLLKESGINIAYPGEWKCAQADGGPYSGNYTTDAKFIARMLDAAQQVGVKQLIRDYTLNGILMSDEYESDEAAAQAARRAVAHYSEHPALYGHLIYDEPVLNMLPACTRAMRRYQLAFPELCGYVNLCPVIGSAADFSDENWNPDECTAYEYYVDRYLELSSADYISYDHYPIFGNNETGKTGLEPTFLYNMDIVKRRAAERGLETWTFLQSCGYGNINRVPTSEADISFQVYSFLAYGGDCINWFCYWSPIRYDGRTYFREAMIELDGSKTAVYDYVSEINHEVLAFDHIYKNFEWQGVMCKIGRENQMGENDNFAYIQENALKSHERISQISCEQDTLIGVFEDGEGRDGFMVVNFTDPGQQLGSTVDLNLVDCKHALVVQNGEQRTVKCRGGKLTLELDSGDGAFVIPL